MRILITPEANTAETTGSIYRNNALAMEERLRMLGGAKKVIALMEQLVDATGAPC